MRRDYSTIIVETCHKMEADITIIVHSRDENLTRVLHEMCRAAVRKAISPLDSHANDEHERLSADVPPSVGGSTSSIPLVELVDEPSDAQKL